MIEFQGGEAILAHPYWSALTTNDIFSCFGYIGTEVFNNSCFHRWDKGYSMVYWDNLYLLKKYFWFASDDAHNHSNDHCPNDACGAWIMVKSKNLDVNSIMNSIKQGLFYASRGPEIQKCKN